VLSISSSISERSGPTIDLGMCAYTTTNIEALTCPPGYGRQSICAARNGYSATHDKELFIVLWVMEGKIGKVVSEVRSGSEGEAHLILLLSNRP
jgi:hypothetical protein